MKSVPMEFLSTTTFANEKNLKPADLFDLLSNAGWIEKKNEKWNLTEEGKKMGGHLKSSQKFGEYIVWPQNLQLPAKKQSNIKATMLNATALGERFNISSKRVNLLLHDLGWIQKTVAGWELTKIGRQLGGKQFEHDTSGSTYVLWAESILQHPELSIISNDQGGVKMQANANQTYEPTIDANIQEDFRLKYPAEYRTKDGHYVRSKAEMAIDDSLYLWGITHAYEKKLSNTEENVISDFYIPSGKDRPAVYIEYWGLEDNVEYVKRKEKKIAIYAKLDLQLIQMYDHDIKNIEDNLQKYLLKHKITVHS